MLKRKIDTYLLEWLNTRKTALLVDGARQVGKTFSIKKFGNDNFKNFININFAERTDLIDLFVQIRDSKQVLVNLSAIAGESLIENETLIFFDEIQLLYQRREYLKKNHQLDLNTQDIITAIKSLVIDGKYRFILSGSLLGILINDITLMPTGYLDEYQMFPLDFEEFLWSGGVGKEAIDYLRECFEKLQKVDEPVNKLFLEYFRQYILIGGMPEAVNTYRQTQNLFTLQTIQEQIRNKYTYDITTYLNSTEKKLYLREVYDAIPSELNSKNKKFMSSHVVDASYLKRHLVKDDFIWLTTAGVAIAQYNVTEPILPLSLAKEHKTLKLFMNDVGLLISALCSTGIREKLLKNELEINYGAPYENAVAQELYAHGYHKDLYYYNSKKHGEVDFIIEYQNDVLPIEIKSGKPNALSYYNHSALNGMIGRYNIDMAFVLGECNVSKENNHIYQLPVYMIMFIMK